MLSLVGRLSTTVPMYSVVLFFFKLIFNAALVILGFRLKLDCRINWHFLMIMLSLLFYQSMGIVIWLVSCSAFVGWSCIYQALRMWKPSQTSEWHCRCVTTVHACTVLALSSYAWLIQGPSPWYHPGMI